MPGPSDGSALAFVMVAGPQIISTIVLASGVVLVFFIALEINNLVGA
jgi:hypothetical protein